jgi:hypothetical protein
MKKKEIEKKKIDNDNTMDNFILVYGIIGLICFLDLRIGIASNSMFISNLRSSLTIIYFYSQAFIFPFIIFMYSAFGNYDPSSKRSSLNILLCIIDSILSVVLFWFFPYPINSEIYNYNKALYYTLGAIYSVMPLLFFVFNHKKLNISFFKKIIGRVIMIIVTGALLLLLTSCDVSNIG